MNLAKTAELIEMPFGGGPTRVGARNLVKMGIHVGATWQIRFNDSYYYGVNML